MAASHSTHSVERERRAFSGWLVLILIVLWFIATIAVMGSTAVSANADAISPLATGLRVWAAILMIAFGVLACFGFFTLQPNEARVLILFGAYKGTVRRSGFHWANPLYSRDRGNVPGAAPVPKRVKVGPISVSDGTVTRPKLTTKLSLRAHNFNSETLKVNDKRGNPVEIAAVVVWRVEDTAQAVFDVEDYESYVQVQSESAIRSIASLYAYDHGEEHELTLRGGGDEVAQELGKELGVRLRKAGVAVDEARLTHLAYAPEIAPAMLRRQQAEAVIAAREKIVLGAVSMVEMALNELAKKKVVTLDEERKAAMVSNLLVVLCGTEEASPVINTGTLYT
jgi:regulator of protease activity HflC (stomatin/prohibitin superfamily)